MILICNVVSYYYKGRLWIGENSPVTPHKCFPPIRSRNDTDREEHNRYNTYNNTPRKTFDWAPNWTPFIISIQLIANVHWRLLWFVSDILDRCLCYERIITPSQKRPYTPHTQYTYKGASHKNFFRNTGETYANYCKAHPRLIRVISTY